MNDVFYLIFRQVRIPALAVLVVYSVAVLGMTLIPGIEVNGQTTHMTIFQAFYWVSYTATTIGYGDVVPVTAVGRVLAAITAVIGIALFGLPAGIFAAGFIEELQAQPRPGLVCPHCGEPLGHQDRDEEA